MTRYRSLDGLRGVAALVVVVHHALLLSPVLSDAYFRGEPAPQDQPWVATLLASPLHIIWAGPEAVLLFFILSGIVLTMPALKPGFAWSAYYPRRIVRLYAPVAGAVLITLAILRVAPRHYDPTFSGWVNSHEQAYTLIPLVQDLTLVSGTSGVITPLWSLTLEVIFSLALPIYVLALGLTLRRRRGTYIAAAALLTWLILGIAAQQLPDNEAIRPIALGFFYLGVFALGSLMALHWPKLSTVLTNYFSTRKGKASAYPLLGLAIVLSIGHWMFPALRPGTGSPSPINLASIAGVVALVLIAAFNRPFARALEMRPVLWLGRISFSLYLVHESIMLGIRHALPTQSPVTVGLIAVPVSLAIAWGFHRLVERPSHTLSVAAGQLTVAKVQRLQTSSERPKGARGRHAQGSTNPAPSDY